MVTLRTSLMCLMLGILFTLCLQSPAGEGSQGPRPQPVDLVRYAGVDVPPVFPVTPVLPEVLIKNQSHVLLATVRLPARPEKRDLIQDPITDAVAEVKDVYFHKSSDGLKWQISILIGPPG